MDSLITRRLGIKVAILVNLFLVVIVASGSWYLIDQQAKVLEEQFLERGRLLSMIGAKSIGRMIEEAVDNGVFSITDALDTDYQAIPGFDPQKYHTKYDSYTDKAFVGVQDEFMKDTYTAYAVAVDINGYVPTHNIIFQQPITGDREKDKVGNRTKRIFNDAIGRAAATNTKPGSLQVYTRDTGEVMWDLSSPIYVKGKHWGGFRYGISIGAVEAAKRNLALQQLAIMGGILIASFIAVFVVVNRALVPLRQCTLMAAELADGKMDQPITSTSKDEIGQLAEVLERLRFSLNVAMKKLRG